MATKSGKLKKRDSCDIAVVGGGPAGALTAIHLARAGFSVVVFEREKKAVQKVYGEFLGAECLPLLREVGVDPIALGGVEITSFRLHGPRQTVETKLPKRAVGLTRIELTKAMIEVAVDAGVDVRLGVAVDEIVEGLDSPSGSILISTSEGETRAQRLVLATGNVDFKSANDRVGRDEDYIGFQMHLRLKPSTAALIKKSWDLFVFDYGYGCISPIEGGLANFCFIIKRSVVQTLGDDWDALTSHIGASCWSASHYLDGAEPQAKQFTRLDHLPLGFLRRDPPPAGMFFVGDQMAVIPAMTGDELSISLATARSAADAIIEDVGGSKRLRFAQEASRGYQRAMRKMLRLQLDAAFAVHQLFKKPGLVDMTTYAIKAFPGVFNKVYKTTRPRILTAKERASLTSRRGPALRTSAPSRG
ncbi:MAG: FAD-dependent oxidoreductase [Proteobacteria bacterium]|nr:MAG: FAD-dependent oxidoreductase [Pseudomonadota bacterium]